MTRLKISMLVLLLLLVCLTYALNADKLRASFRQLGGDQKIFNEWMDIINTGSELNIDARLQRINNYINRKIIYTDDIDAWSQSDYWATPLESLAKGKGDCEDYVIAKYYSLRNMNVPDAQLRLVYVKARIGGPNSTIQQAHMVLAFYPSGESEPLILDNLISDIRSASRRTDLSPVFSFNGQGVFAGAGANASVGPGGTSRLSRWQDLVERARQEGFD